MAQKLIRKWLKSFSTPPSLPRHMRQIVSAGVDGGLSGVSSVRRPGSEDPYQAPVEIYIQYLNEYCIQIFLNFFFFRISDKKLINMLRLIAFLVIYCTWRVLLDQCSKTKIVDGKEYHLRWELKTANEINFRTTLDLVMNKKENFGCWVRPNYERVN